MDKTAERDPNSIPTANQDEHRGYWVALAFVPDAEKGTQTETSNEEGRCSIISDTERGLKAINSFIGPPK